MKFRVISYGEWPNNAKNEICLKQDGWDDFCFKTTFQAYYQGQFIGTVKIAFAGMEKGQSTFDYIKGRLFDQLPNDYISLWQSEKAYETIAKINVNNNYNIFKQLNDLAFDLSLYEEYKEEASVRESLFREVTDFQCKKQFHRIATGGEILTQYQFSIELKSANGPLNIGFKVLPNTKPSSNIHVVIGRNGIGKTNLIKSLADSICNGLNEQIVLKYDMSESSDTFANVICVSFSPFDDYSNIIELQKNPVDKRPKCTYIGLDRENGDLLTSIEEQFILALKGCLSSKAKLERWKKTIEIIESDPMFAEISIGNLESKNDGKEDNTLISRAKEMFGLLSSGHKCVLSLLTCCVNDLEEQSVVLIDEPENHLHPPLLSAFMQALSFLLNDRNGMAIISTHSPVVLQEVPKSCVWILNRIGDAWQANRPQFETFGADIGSLTREVFGLEVLHSGYHKMIKDVVDKSHSLEQVLNEFDNNLGNEAIALANILYSQKKREMDND